MKKTKSPSYDKPMTIIGENTELNAALLKSSEAVKIIGKFTGDIESSSSVVIAGTGYVKGNISAEFAYVCGIIEGNIDVTHTVQIARSGNVVGSITCANIITDEGAIINGSCTMRQPSAAASSDYLD